MPALGINFNAANVAPYEPGNPIWEGMVPHRIVRTEISPTRANDGSRMLVLHVQAVGGQYQGQENRINLNLWNKSPKSSEIAGRQLSSICHCVGRPQISDSDQLVGGLFVGVWAKDTSDLQDATTGAMRTVESCQIKEYLMADGRTLKEYAAGQPASRPMAGIVSAPAAGPGAAPMQQPQGGGFPQGGAPQVQQPPMQTGQQPGGFPGQQPQGQQPGFPQAGGQAPGGFPQQPQGGQPQGQFAPQTGGPAPGAFAPVQNGAMPGQGGPGTPTAGSPGSFPGQQPQGGQPGGFPGQGGGQPGAFQPGQPGAWGAPQQ